MIEWVWPEFGLVKIKVFPSDNTLCMSKLSLSNCTTLYNFSDVDIRSCCWKIYSSVLSILKVNNVCIYSFSTIIFFYLSHIEGVFSSLDVVFYIFIHLWHAQNVKLQKTWVAVFFTSGEKYIIFYFQWWPKFYFVF